MPAAGGDRSRPLEKDGTDSFLEAIGHGVAHGVEPALAAVSMQPALGVRTLGVGAEEEKLRPLRVVELRGIGRTRDMRFAAAAELDLGTRPAIGATDEQHQCGL